ncbi:hypothetical protein BSL78_16675 [Apostichopus japonicus]|uniref:Ig-like domain-containing protein n=1 Tax=Stichopus japonicus TaxID=307972 RepID=A0A2G8KES4_STIJA|nr:hypothetical protein BSL78_16675 [Apostichopus japonicus]
MACSPIVKSFSLLVTACVLNLNFICYGQPVALSPTKDDVIFAGERIVLMCSLSNSRINDSVSMMIIDDNGFVIPSGRLNTASEYTEVTSKIFIQNTTAFNCAVTNWQGLDYNIDIIVKPLPSSLPYCSSNYTDGIIVGEVVNIKCCISPGKTLRWNADSDVFFEEIRDNAWTMTNTNYINVKPTITQNGTLFTCEAHEENHTDVCIIGPINVFETLTISIATDKASRERTLQAGGTSNYSCTSLPNSFVQWITPNGLVDSGIEFSVVGPTVMVTVLPNSTFTGNFVLICSGKLNGIIAQGNITLQIPNDATMTNASTNTPVLLTNSSGANILLLIVLYFTLIFLVIIFLLSFLICLKYKHIKQSPKVKEDSKVSTVSVVDYHGYDLPPCAKNAEHVPRGLEATNQNYERRLRTNIDQVPVRKEIRKIALDDGGLLSLHTNVTSRPPSQMCNDDEGVVFDDERFERNHDKKGQFTQLPKRSSALKQTTTSATKDYLTKVGDQSLSVKYDTEMIHFRHILIDEDELEDDDLDEADEYWENFL